MSDTEKENTAIISSIGFFTQASMTAIQAGASVYLLSTGETQTGSTCLGSSILFGLLTIRHAAFEVVARLREPAKPISNTHQPVKNGPSLKL